MTDEAALSVLRRIMAPRERASAGERCEMCGEDIASEHGHVASLGERRLLCTCRACYLLFTQEGAGGRRLRAVPERYRLASEFAISQEQWDELAIPVDLVFLFQQGALDEAQAASLVACYPSPAGATESELDLHLWSDLAAQNPVLADAQPDVEAVLVRRRGPGRYDCFLVPIDACYELVGIVRMHWRGFQGGPEVWRRIDEFFGELRTRADRGG